MKFTFLGAADGTPLTKQFTKEGDGVSRSDYPLVRNFNSISVAASNLRELYAAIEELGGAGFCLLKGRTKKVLDNEPRAGTTDPTAPTRWVCLDLDFESGFDSIDHFLECLQPGLSTTEYIFQHSSRAGITSEPGLRGHVFFRLQESLTPQSLKLWLRLKNLTVPQLREQIRLSANGLSLIYPLDTTTCQNDKLIYISPPVCRGFDDPLAGQRLEFFERPDSAATILLQNDLNVEQLTTNVTDELREKAKLPRKIGNIIHHGNLDILDNPDPTEVTGVKEARNFVYLNLEGGDSWGYYYPIDNPTYLYNFKGEPIVRLKDICPKYFKEKFPDLANAGQERVHMAFHEPRQDVHYAGFHDPISGLNDFNLCKRGNLRDFFLSRGLEPPEFYDDWDYAFRPDIETPFDAERRFVNSFQPTHYMKVKPAESPPAPPKTINKVIKHICVDDETYNHFMNWLAVIFQKRIKTGTAWIFHGTEGTGKGTLLNCILKPLLKYCVEIQADKFLDSFNGHLEDPLIVFVDEVHLETTKDTTRLLNMWKHMITEPTLQIRRMRTNAYEVKSFCNLIFASNHPDPIPIGDASRRFNIAPMQEQPIKLTATDIAMLKQELPVFAAFLHHYKADIALASTYLKNQARNDMIQASTNTVDAWFREFRNGNLAYFAHYLVKGPMPLTPGNTYPEYAAAIKRWAMIANTEDPLVKRDEMQAVYKYMQGLNSLSPSKFSRMCTIHNTKITSVRIGSEVHRGVPVPLRAEKELIDEILKDSHTELYSAKSA